MHDIRLDLGVWILVGLVDSLLYTVLRRRRWSWSLGLVLHVVWTACLWWGLFMLGTHPGAMVRAGAGTLLVAAAGAGFLMPLSSETELRDYAVLAWSTGAFLYALYVTDPLAVAIMTGAGIALIAGWWFYRTPGSETLHAARSLGIAAGLLLAAAIFLPVQATAVPTKFAFVAWLYIAVIAILSGCVPVQGWAVSSLHRLEGKQLLLWVGVILPGAIVALERAIRMQPLSVQNIVLGTALGLGCISAVWEGLLALRMSSPRERHARLMLMDVSLMVVGVGSGSPYGWTGALLLVLVHVGTLPFVGDREGSSTDRVVRTGAWTFLGGIPFTAVFWGRWMVLLAAWNAGSWYPWCVCAAMALAAVASFRQARFALQLPAQSARFQSWCSLGALAFQLALGLAPAALGSAVFGMTLLPGVGH